MPGILLQLYVSPEAVACLIHPIIDRESFADGVYYNATPSLGMDFITDLKLLYHATNRLRSDGLVIAGPITLSQCVNNAADCNPIVEKAFVAAWPIALGNHTISLNGKTFQKWGFVPVTINWKALVDQSGMYERFAQLGHEFLLTRFDRIYNVTKEHVVLAESRGFQNAMGFTSVTTPVKTANNEWEITVNYNLCETLMWRTWVIPIVVLVSL
jgi:hypothetical protein